jgi:DNA-binding IclR family transcriptional regulator
MSDHDVQGVLRHTQYWASVTHAASAPDPSDVMRAVTGIRTHGYITDCGVLKSGVGTVAYPVPSPFKDTPIALLVTGPAVRIKHDECKIRRAIELYVSSYRVHAQR